MLNTLKFIWNHPISSSNRLAAYSRFVRWQLGTRLLSAPILIPFVEKACLVAERSMTGATGNLYCGLHEFCDMGFLLHFLRSDDLFVDIGANIGSYTILASGVLGARSISMEPVPSTFDSLQRNIRVNNISHIVEARQLAAGAEAGSVRFSIDRDCVNQVVSACYPGEYLQIPIISLDNLLVNQSPTLWKVDVEGYELEVLKGATKSLSNPTLKAVMLEADSSEIFDLMSQTGFKHARYDPLNRQLQLKSEKPLRSQRGVVNNLWVRDFEFVRERCRSSRSFRVYGKEF